MPRVNMISEHVAILVAEELLSQGLIRTEKIRGRREIVDSVIAAGQVEVGQTYIPPGDYEDWFEPYEPVEKTDVRVVSEAERNLANALIKIIEDASNQEGR